MKDPRSFAIHRNPKGWPTWYQKYLEAWWVVTGKWTLHKAWQEGHDHGVKREYTRLITNKGAVAELEYAKRK